MTSENVNCLIKKKMAKKSTSSQIVSRVFQHFMGTSSQKKSSTKSLFNGFIGGLVFGGIATWLALYFMNNKKKPSSASSTTPATKITKMVQHFIRKYKSPFTCFQTENVQNIENVFNVDESYTFIDTQNNNSKIDMNLTFDLIHSTPGSSELYIQATGENAAPWNDFSSLVYYDNNHVYNLNCPDARYQISPTQSSDVIIYVSDGALKVMQDAGIQVDNTGDGQCPSDGVMEVGISNINQCIDKIGLLSVLDNNAFPNIVGQGMNLGLEIEQGVLYVGGRDGLDTSKLTVTTDSHETKPFDQVFKFFLNTSQYDSVIKTFAPNVCFQSVSVSPSAYETILAGYGSINNGSIQPLWIIL